MKRRITVIAGIVLVFLACSKDNIQSKPSIKLKSLSSNFVPLNGDLSVDIEYTDKEGDIKGDTIQLIKVRTNQWQTPTIEGTNTINFTLADNVPENSKGVIELRLRYATYLITAINPVGPGGKAQNDSLTMKFVLKDNASNVSDTLVVKDIVIERK